VTSDSAQARGDELLARVLTGDEWESGIANDLLKEFFRGYPVDNLVKLLRSDNQKVVESGAWIASELAREARSVLTDLLPLFEYPDPRVRCHVIETTLTAATATEGEVIARAVTRMSDADQRVRRRAFELTARADQSPLVAGVPYMKEPEIAGLLEWALEVESESRDDDEIAVRLRESDGLRLLFAVVAAARVYGRNPHYLELAASLSESEAQSLAASELAWLSKLHEQAERRRERSEH
jgi:hypothetical protein